jgi:hypothetical protein
MYLRKKYKFDIGILIIHENVVIGSRSAKSWSQIITNFSYRNGYLRKKLLEKWT